VWEEPFDDAMRAHVVHVEDLGTYKIMTLNLDGAPLKVRLAEDKPVPEGRRTSVFRAVADGLRRRVPAGRSTQATRGAAMNRNNKAWWLVLPVFLLVAFSAVIPMMTVVNYSVQDIFDQSSRYFVGADWYRKCCAIHACMTRCCASSSTRPACC
jgi:hypothetical protein